MSLFLSLLIFMSIIFLITNDKAIRYKRENRKSQILRFDVSDYLEQITKGKYKIIKTVERNGVNEKEISLNQRNYESKRLENLINVIHEYKLYELRKKRNKDAAIYILLKPIIKEISTVIFPCLFVVNLFFQSFYFTVILVILYLLIICYYEITVNKALKQALFETKSILVKNDDYCDKKEKFIELVLKKNKLKMFVHFVFIKGAL